MSEKIVIEISGGTLQAVSMDNPQNFQVIVVDWDDINEGGKAEIISANKIENLDPTTLQELKNVEAR